MLGKVLLQLVVCKLPRLLQSMCGSSDFNVDVSIRCNFGLELVLVDDLLWNVFQWHLHVFKAVQRCVWVRVFDICGQALSFAS